MQTTWTRRKFLGTAAVGPAFGAAASLKRLQASAANAGGADLDRMWDVVVCGGGPSGVMAAWAAALEGAACLLVERQPILGGMATSGLVGPISKFRFNGRLMVEGLPWRFVSLLKSHQGSVLDLPSGNVPFEAEAYAAGAHDVLTKAGVCVCMDTEMVDASCLSDGRIESITVERQGRRQTIGGRMFVDATGMGNLICRTSLPAPLRAQAEELQPMSLIFRLENVDTKSLVVWMAEDRTRYSQPQLREALQKAAGERRIGLFGGPWAVFGSTIRPGSVSVNATRYAGAATDPSVLARAKAAMSAEIPAMIEVFRQSHPSFANCSLRDVAAVVGVRESRGAVGEYCLTAEDVRGGRIFEDAIALGGHPLDMHRSKDATQEAPFLDRPYSIPYRCLVPKGSRNLLVSGGLISADRQAFSSARVQAQCMATGQAAGTAAALCAAGAVLPSTLDFRQLRQRLAAHGAVLRPSIEKGAMS